MHPGSRVDDAGSTVAANDRTDEVLRLRATLASIAPGTPCATASSGSCAAAPAPCWCSAATRPSTAISTGGFFLDIPFTATGLRELAKMDGAIVLDKDAGRILHAAVHLMPDPSILSEETGTRHRTADRVARQTGYPVISVSQSMQIIAVYVGGTRYVLEDSGQILSRANQALATLERYKLRLDEVSSTLSALEIEDLVTTRDVAVVAQRLEMVTRIAREIEDYVLELGSDGRLLSLQLDELVTGVDLERELVIRDYLPDQPPQAHPEDVLGATWRPSARPSSSTSPRWRGRSASARASTSTARSPRAATGCWPRCPGCPARSWTGWSSTSAACRSCSRRASTTCRPSTGSASCGPAASARACPGWPSPASSSATSRRGGCRCTTSCWSPLRSLCGLVAGVFFAFSTFVMSGLARLPPADGIRAMQSINRRRRSRRPSWRCSSGRRCSRW